MLRYRSRRKAVLEQLNAFISNDCAVLWTRDLLLSGMMVSMLTEEERKTKRNMSREQSIRTVAMQSRKDLETT